SAKVLLTGDGGDDIFLGYPRHLRYLRMQDAARFIPVAAGPVWQGIRKVWPRYGVMRRAGHALDYLLGGLGGVLSATPGLPALAAAGALGDRLRSVCVPARTIPWSVRAGRNLLTDYLAYDREHQFVAEYMTKVDGATMYWSLEARSPFLDTDLWEWGSSLPYRVRLHGGQLKSILREIARRRISERVAAGRKRGFTIPVEQWIAGPWSGTARELLTDSLVARAGWLDRSALMRMLDRSIASGVAPTVLWHALVLEAWLRHAASETSVRRHLVASGAP
ncbi:MAG TPA: asparagine synthase-related protein, partial [Gemmatimonadaceae bacterium]